MTMFPVVSIAVFAVFAVCAGDATGDTTTARPSLAAQAADLVRGTRFVEARPAPPAPAEPAGSRWITPASELLSPPPAVTTRFQDGLLYGEISVTETPDWSLITPVYRILPRVLKGFGVPTGGSAGSPSFDPVTLTYWWE